MILADSSVWFQHFRSLDEQLLAYIKTGSLRMHAFVMGELAVGGLPRRTAALDLLARIKKIPMAKDNEVLAFVDRHALHGLGIGYFDAHLLTAAQLTPGTEFWTRDRRLNEAAKRLGLALRHH